MTYIARAVPFGFPDVSTRYDATPMRRYSIVQTTGNSQSGGAKSGLLMAVKVSILFCVRNADKLPTASGIAIQVMKFFHWIFKKTPPSSTMIRTAVLFYSFCIGETGMQNVLTSGGQLLHRAARYEKQDEKDDVQGVKECQAGFSRFLMAFIEE